MKDVSLLPDDALEKSRDEVARDRRLPGFAVGTKDVGHDFTGWSTKVDELRRNGWTEGMVDIGRCLADEDAARFAFETLRWGWGDRAPCPHCGALRGGRRLDAVSGRPGLWRCNRCGKQFTVTVGTVMAATHVPLHLWVYAVYVLCTARDGVTVSELRHELGLSYTATRSLLGRLNAVLRFSGALTPRQAPEELYRRVGRVSLRAWDTVEVCARLVGRIPENRAG